MVKALFRTHAGGSYLEDVKAAGESLIGFAKDNPSEDAQQGTEHWGEEHADEDEGTDYRAVQSDLDDLRLEGAKWTSYERMAGRFCCSPATVHKAVANGTVELQDWASKQRRPSRLNVCPEVADVAFASTPQSREPDPADVIEQLDVDVAMDYLLSQAGPDERDRIKSMSRADQRALAEMAYRDPDQSEQIFRHRQVGRRKERI